MWQRQVNKSHPDIQVDPQGLVQRDAENGVRLLVDRFPGTPGALAQRLGHFLKHDEFLHVFFPIPKGL